MTLEDVPVPSPSLGQVLIRNRAVGLNFFDILQIQGKYQSKPSFPFTVGREVAGHAEAVGEGVGKFSVGEAVLAFPDGGGYAEYSLAAADRTFPKPDEMDFPAAAGMATTYQTSYFALTRRARLQEGEWLLVHAGASGVGVAALQLGKALGARTIATAGSDEKLAYRFIRNRAVGLNFFDILQIQGKYQSKPSFPFTVGREVAGHAEAVGEGVGKFSVGEAVLAFPDGGGYAEYSLAAADRTFPKPDEMDFPAAAGMATTYQTSYFALTRRARLQEGEWLLVHAGASGVGVAALQLGKALGARTIATAGQR